MKKLHILLLGFLITALGLWLRLNATLLTDLSSDEVLSIQVSKLPLKDLALSMQSYWDLVHPPLYYVLLKGWITFSHEAWWLRSFSILWFIPSCILLYAVGKRVTNSFGGLFVILLFSVHPLFVTVGFVARMYSLGLFLCLLALYLYLKSFELKKHTTLLLIAASVAMSLAFVTSYITLWLYISLSAWAIYLWLKNKKEAAIQTGICIGVSLVLSMYQILVMLHSFMFSNVRVGSVDMITQYDAWYYTDQVAKLMGFNEGYPSHYFSLIIFGFALTYVLFSVPNLKNKDHSLVKEGSVFFGLLFSVPLLCSLLYSVFIKPLFLDRNLLVSGLGYLFSLTLALYEFFKEKKYLAVFFVVLICGFYLYQSFLLTGFYVGNEARMTIERIHETPNAAVVIGGACCLHNLEHYYFKYFLNSSISVTKFVDVKKASELPYQTDTVFVYTYPSEQNTEITEYLTNVYCKKVRCIIMED